MDGHACAYMLDYQGQLQRYPSLAHLKQMSGATSND